MKNEPESSYWDGLPEHIEVLEEAEAEHPPKPNSLETQYSSGHNTTSALSIGARGRLRITGTFWSLLGSCIRWDRFNGKGV